MRPPPDVTAVVLTLGRTPLLTPCLEALRREGGTRLELIVVDQAESSVRLPAGLADRVLRPGRNLGFAGGNNLGIAVAAGELVATVNDDAVVEPGWLGLLSAALASDPRAAAAQGVNLMLDRPHLADGCGLGWNRWWQAVQLGHGLPAPDPGGERRAVFGVSATVALYRRQALAGVARRGEVFDARLHAYYEDVELACRLRHAGWRALLVPAARARHAGSASAGGTTARRKRWRLVYGNRYLATARCQGGRFWRCLPRMAARDLLDLARAARRADGVRLAGIAGGWARALRLLPLYVRRGAACAPCAPCAPCTDGAFVTEAVPDEGLAAEPRRP
jgi:GT2 family glycosyltransferase